MANSAFTIAGQAGTVPGRNRLFNGDFQVWQRGAGGSASFSQAASTTAYTADRWQLLTSANQASTVTQSAGATSGSWLAKVQRNTGQTGTQSLLFTQSLTRDMCIGAAGNQITVSYNAKAGANFSPVTFVMNCYSGTGTTDKSGQNAAFTGSAVACSVSTTGLSTTLTRYTATSVALASNVTQLAVEFSIAPVGTAGADDSYYVGDVQIEVSPVQTAYDRLPFAQSLRNCQAFYQKSFLYATSPAQNASYNSAAIWSSNSAGAVNGYSNTFNFIVPVRVASTGNFTFYSPSAATAQAYDVTAAAACTATACTNVAEYGFVLEAVGNASTAKSDAIAVHWQYDCDLT